MLFDNKHINVLLLNLVLYVLIYKLYSYFSKVRFLEFFFKRILV